MEKYIVYKTTNLVNNKIYIGVHKTATPYDFDGYIGNGIWIRKPYTYQKAKTKLQQAVKRYGIHNFYRETLQVFNTAQDAYYLEGLIVDENFLARDDVYNMVLGGEMQQYRTLTTYKYDLNGNFIEQFESIRSASKLINVIPSTLAQAILYKRSCRGFYWTTKKVNHLDTSDYNIPIKNYRVCIYNLDGSFYKEYNSCNEAAQDIGVAGVERAAKLGYILNKNYYACFIKDSSYSKARTIYTKTRPVFKYSSSGDFLEAYNSQYEAEKDNPGSDISRAIKGKKLCSNHYLWSLDKLEYFNKPKIKQIRKVGLFDEEGNLIKEWKSGKQCALEWGKGVYHCLKGEYPRHKGHIFKYID